MKRCTSFQHDSALSTKDSGSLKPLEESAPKDGGTFILSDVRRRLKKRKEVLKVTAILSYVRSDLTIQVTDRLVSTMGEGALKDYDRVANKGVVVGGSDAVVAIAYTGIAYFGSEPTDTWIARWAAGSPTVAGMSMRMNTPLHLQAVADRVAEGLREQIRLGRGRYDGFPHEVVIAGQQRRRGDEEVPILWKVQRNGLAGSSVELVREDLSSLRRNSVARVEATGRVPAAVLEEVRSLTQGESPINEPAEIEAILVAAIRESAKLEDGVGQDCMVVRIPGLNAPVRVEYCPIDEGETITVDDQGAELPPAFTPAFVGHSMILAPAHFDSFRGFEIEGLKVENAAPGKRAYWDEESQTFVAGWGVQPRKPSPGRGN